MGNKERKYPQHGYSAGLQFDSDRGISGEHLGYLNGGFHQLVDALEKSIVSRGGVIRTRTPVSSVSFKDGKWEAGGVRYDAIISTIPPQELERIGGPALPRIPYQGAACMTLALERDVTEGIYWLNIKGSRSVWCCYYPHEFYTIHQIRGTYSVPGILLQRNSSSRS